MIHGLSDTVRCVNAGCPGNRWSQMDDWNTRVINNNDAFEQYAASLQQERERYRELASAAESLLSEYGDAPADPESALNRLNYKKHFLLHQILESHKEK